MSRFLAQTATRRLSLVTGTRHAHVSSVLQSQYQQYLHHHHHQQQPHHQQHQLPLRSSHFHSTAFVASSSTEIVSTIEFSSEKIKALFDKILYLDMVEIHLLTEVLNEKMGITLTDADRAQMAKGGSGGAAGGAVQAEAVEEVKKTAFDLKLTGFDAKSKIKVIKEVRAMAGLGLKEAKELVEGAPKVVMKGIKMEEAEKLKAKLEALGATIEIS